MPALSLLIHHTLRRSVLEGNQKSSTVSRVRGEDGVHDCIHEANTNLLEEAAIKRASMFSIFACSSATLNFRANSWDANTFARCSNDKLPSESLEATHFRHCQHTAPGSLTPTLPSPTRATLFCHLRHKKAFPAAANTITFLVDIPHLDHDLDLGLLSRPPANTTPISVSVSGRGPTFGLGLLAQQTKAAEMPDKIHQWVVSGAQTSAASPPLRGLLNAKSSTSPQHAQNTSPESVLG